MDWDLYSIVKGVLITMGIIFSIVLIGTLPVYAALQVLKLITGE